jgi:hypothetical protein
VRNSWGANYAEPETFLFNIQGPSPIGVPTNIPPDAVDEPTAA